MSISILLAEKIAQLFLILLMGYLMVRVGLLKPEDSRVLSVIMVYLVMPCMILNAFQIDNTPEVRTGIAYSFVVAGIMHLLFLALTALLKKPLKLDVIERCAVIYSNASALVIPLLQATLGSEYVVYSCGFIMMIIYTVKSRLMTKSIIKMHCTASGDHKYICNSILNKQFCNIVGYLHSHNLALQCFVNYLCHIFNLLICHTRINTNPECRCHNTVSLL